MPRSVLGSGEFWKFFLGCVPGTGSRIDLGSRCRRESRAFGSFGQACLVTEEPCLLTEPRGLPSPWVPPAAGAQATSQPPPGLHQVQLLAASDLILVSSGQDIQHIYAHGVESAFLFCFIIILGLSHDSELLGPEQCLRVPRRDGFPPLQSLLSYR